MSDLLLHWLNHELALSSPVTNVERDFASGYLLGELLQRLNQQHNLSDFMDSAIADAKIINFCLLEPTLRRLGVRFDARTATAIMNGKAGAAANLLYQIKMAAERVARAPRVSTKESDVLALHNMPPKLAKPSYDAAHHYFFEHSVRRQVKSLAELKRERDAVEEERQRMRAYRAQQARIAEQLEVTKAERLHQAFIHSEFIKTALDETDTPAWRLALATKRAREQRQALFYQQLVAEQARKMQTHTFSLRQTVERDLDDFERRGASTKSPNGSTRSRKSQGYGLRSLSTTLERQAALQGPGLRDPAKPIVLGDAPIAEQLANTSALRDQRQVRERRRDQFERRRKRFLQDALHGQGHANASRMIGDLERLVGRVTHHEGESKQAMAKILVYKEIATENRLRREESYANRREMDAHEAIDRDTAVFELLFAKYNDDWEIQGIHKRQRLSARAAAQQHENRLVAGLALHEIISFAMVVAAKREDSMHSRDSGAFLPNEESWDELQFQFAQSGVEALAAEEEKEETGDALLQHQLVQYLERFATPSFMDLDYVGAVTKGSSVSPWIPSDWKFVAAVEILEDRFVLGETVKYLRWLTHAEAPSPQTEKATVEELEDTNAPVEDAEQTPPATDQEEQAQVEVQDASPVETASGEAVIEVLRDSEAQGDDNTDTPAVPQAEEVVCVDPEPAIALPRLCILLLGPPFAGKQTQAKRLAEKYSLALLSVEQQLQDAIAQQTELGQRAHSLLVSGGEIPPVLYSQLAVDAILRLDKPYRNRWVIFDLPSTQAHAQSLEEALTGFIEPSRIPSPFDHVSLLAPGCAKPKLPKSFLHGKSGVDLVFFLDCAESSVLERCLGALEDGVTHEQKHHLLLAPPELDATDRHRLQHVNTTSNASELLSLQCLSTDDFAGDEKQWFTRFDTLRGIATTESLEGQSVAITRSLTVEATEERLFGFVDAFFEQQHAAEDARQRERELQETVDMQNEESRHRKIMELKQTILRAQEEVTKAQHAVQQAEETKAKKEEIAELRGAIETAKKQVELALVDARDWCFEESLRVRNAQSLYSARLWPSMARVLAATWDAMEREYTDVMKCCLRMQRQQRKRVEQRVSWLVATVCRLLRRIDAKQRLVDAFQTQFNGVVDEMRFEDATKSELHARADVLQDELCMATTTKQRESEQALRDLMGDGWLEDTCQWLALGFQRALQAECDRFRVALQLLVDAFAAASDEPAQLAGVGDALKANAPLLAELTLKAFVDTSEEQAAAAAAATAAASVTTPAPAANAKAGAKGGAAAAAKTKPPLASVASVHAGGLTDAVTADPLAVETLLLAYDLVLQKSDAIVQLILHAPPRHEEAAAKPAEPVAPVAAPPATKAGGKTGATPAATPTATPVTSMVLLPRQSIDVATSNFHKAVQFEQELLTRRVRHLQDAAQSACELVARAMRAVEAALCDAIEQRAAREEAAVASLVAHVRSAIESETDLPFYINVQPEQVYRFPTTHHLPEDTRVTVDSRRRLVARAPLDPPAQIEQRDDVMLNARQTRELCRRLQLSQDHEEEEASVMTVVEVTAVLLALASEPHSLPTRWQRADEATLVEIIAAFADGETGLVDTRALVDAMASGTSMLVSIQAEQLERAAAESHDDPEAATVASSADDISGEP